WYRRWWVGPRCWPGKSRRIGRSPGGVSCRRSRGPAARSTRSRGEGWASRPSLFGSRRGLPGEGWRSCTWKPKTQDGRSIGRCASLWHRMTLSTRGIGCRCASSSAAISRGHRAYRAAISSSVGERSRAKGIQNLRRAR
ncbi:MAG: hypothetical protein AVDCRST_MAG05-1304, partial [uncultured Rubrobacteraceae bacterium]